MSKHDVGPAGGIDWQAAYAGDVPYTPVDRDLVALAGKLKPGTALDLGCGSGHNSIWLAERGWRVHGVDIAAGAIKRARRAARAAGMAVVSTYAMPPRGPGRRQALAAARDAVTAGGTLLFAEFEMALAASGWMAAEQLVSFEEVTTMLSGFELERAEVKVARHSHGDESAELPIVLVVARHPRSPTRGHSPGSRPGTETRAG